MIDKAYLLDDTAMQDFVVTGMIVVKSSLPPTFHENIVSLVDAANREQPNPRSGIVEAVPELNQIYEDPAVKGVLCSILGHDMKMHYYSLSHCNPPGFPGQLWHQGSTKDRPRSIWRLMVFYFPRDVTHEMGPTLVAPGTQYRMAANAQLSRYRVFKDQVGVTVTAGSVLIMHYDIWHRGTANRSDRMRYMIKTVFERTSEPTAPSWNADPDSDSPARFRRLRTIRILLDNETETYQQQAIWVNIWKWLHGKRYGESFPESDWFPAYLP